MPTSLAELITDPPEFVADRLTELEEEDLLLVLSNPHLAARFIRYKLKGYRRCDAEAMPTDWHQLIAEAAEWAESMDWFGKQMGFTRECECRECKAAREARSEAEAFDFKSEGF